MGLQFFLGGGDLDAMRVIGSSPVQADWSVVDLSFGVSALLLSGGQRQHSPFATDVMMVLSLFTG